MITDLHLDTEQTVALRSIHSQQSSNSWLALSQEKT